jgi:HSP20 family protein
MAFHSFIARRVLRRARASRAGVDPLAAEDLDALFDDLLRWDGRGDLAETALDPRVAVSEGSEELLLAAELPGFGRGEVEVIVDGDDLTLRGAKKGEAATTSAGRIAGRRASGSFSHTFRIPFEVEADAVRCRMRDGLLTIAVPRPAASQTEARTVPVTTG